MLCVKRVDRLDACFGYCVLQIHVSSVYVFRSEYWDILANRLLSHAFISTIHHSPFTICVQYLTKPVRCALSFIWTLRSLMRKWKLLFEIIELCRQQLKHWHRHSIWKLCLNSSQCTAIMSVEHFPKPFYQQRPENQPYN